MRQDLEQLHGRVAALEELLEKSDQVALAQARKLEIALDEHSERAHALSVSEHLLRDQSTLLQSIVASVSDGIVATDAAGNFVLFNPAAERLIGIGPLAVPPRDWSARYGLFLPDGVTPYP
ncbi:MAG: PAS domain S-box protein, partial [Candidatus Wallbacteria bacterium]|nr:PAS domain S-box protein [Candidatus Wallbacteria bacterium]